ncbi:hypothetical protein A3Q56_04327 [Intoshia linei]|uniref:Sas10 C-terminal domain-containing protein n=1 Tax=Intoshia linei TaxID=1819745 RepID=A0A177B1H3_9BILA|nr:hypothetical protein A3Q56_04327 [Intoshia linei]
MSDSESYIADKYEPSDEENLNEDSNQTDSVSSMSSESESEPDHIKYKWKSKDFYGGVDEGHNIDVSDNEIAEDLEQKEALFLQKELYSKFKNDDFLITETIKNKQVSEDILTTESNEKLDTSIFKTAILFINSVKSTNEITPMDKIKKTYIMNSLFYLQSIKSGNKKLSKKVYNTLIQLKNLLTEFNTKIQPILKKRNVEFNLSNDKSEINTEIVQNEPKRLITKQIMKNRGLTPRRKKIDRNSRIKHKHKYRKALIRRRGQVRPHRKELDKYDGEKYGIRKNVSHSVRLT